MTDPVYLAARAVVGEPCVCGRPTVRVVGYRGTRSPHHWSRALPTCGENNCCTYASFGGLGGALEHGKPRWFVRQGRGKTATAVRE